MFDQNDQNQPVVDAAAAATTAPLPTAPAAPVDQTTADPVDLSVPAAPTDVTAPTADPVADTTSFNMTPMTPDMSPVDQPTADPVDLSAPAAPTDVTAPTADPVADSVTTFSPTPTSGGDELLSIKQEALQNLSPLLNHLDQTPEEKFRTTMMLIQASDDQSMVQAAYAAAKEITDEKIRAQALLDIINEINYFTQQQKPTE